MDKRIAQNALSYFLSEKFSYNGTDFMPLAEIVRELQAEVGNGTETDTSGGPGQIQVT